MSKKMPHSSFPLSNFNILTTDFGQLTPFYFREVVPGDRVKGSSKFQVQLQPLAAPVFQNMQMFVHYYYVPFRVLCLNEEYNAWISREDRTLYASSKPSAMCYTTVGDIVSSINTCFHSVNSTVFPLDYSASCLNGTIWDYLGVGLGEQSDYSKNSDRVDLWPFIAMFKIFLDNYCNTETLFPVQTGIDSNDNPIYQTLDYDKLLFAYSWFQHHAFDYHVAFSDLITFPDSDDVDALHLLMAVNRVRYFNDYFTSAMPATEQAYSAAVPVGSTIKDLRLNNAIQEYNERKARVGHGVADFLWEFFHVKSSDGRLQRSEFLGGGRLNFRIDDVPQDSETDTTALGTLAGNGTIRGGLGHGKRYFEEYGYYFGLCFFTAKQAYYQGISRQLQRSVAQNLYFEAFDGIGDQAIKNGEIFMTNTLATNESTFGYMPRYQDYKVAVNEIHGDFRNSLRYWHASRHFGTAPNINSIQYMYPKPNGLHKIFNYTGFANPQDVDPILVYAGNNFNWRRKMRYSVRPHL